MASDPLVRPWLESRVPDLVPPALAAAFVLIVAGAWRLVTARRARPPALDQIGL